jgi:predicted transcriptional regulator
MRCNLGKKGLEFEEREIMKTLFASGRTYNAIAHELGRSPHTIKKALTDPETTKQVEEIKANLADMFENVAKRLVLSVTDKDIVKINALQRITGAGISVDKMRLLRSESTENISYHVLADHSRSLSEQVRVKEKALEELKRLVNDGK